MSQPEATAEWRSHHLPLRERPHVVYRCFDTDGTLLYVGCTFSFALRHSGHLSKPWAVQVTGVTLEDFPDRATALAAEKEAIRAEQPRFNKVVPGRRVGGPVARTDPVAYIRFSPPLLDRIKAEAKRRRVSVNRLVEWGMEDWLDGRGAKS